MNVRDLRSVLSENPNSPIQFMLPDGSAIPEHFHVTEIGRVQKEFIDCGGTKRSSTTCLLQAWVAQDQDHRLRSSKLLRILEIAEDLLRSTDLPVEVEYEGELLSQFSLLSAEKTSTGILFRLGLKHTDCLARERCGVDTSLAATNDSYCSTPGCCS